MRDGRKLSSVDLSYSTDWLVGSATLELPIYSKKCDRSAGSSITATSTAVARMTSQIRRLRESTVTDGDASGRHSSGAYA